MTTLVETFASNSGQFTTFGYATATPGSFAVSGGNGVLTIPNPGLSAYTAQENSWTISSPNLLVTAKLGTPVQQWPFSGNYLNYSVGIAKDYNNCCLVEVGSTSSSTTINNDVLLLIAGSQTNLAITNNYPVTSFPDAIGMGLQNNLVTLWLSFGGIWQASPIASVNVGTYYDFTAGGALSGWYPAIHLDGQGMSAPVSVGTQLLRYVAPFVAPTSNTTVPNVVNLATATAEADIIGANLTLGTVYNAYSATVAAGYVISQSLTAGVSVEYGTVMSITVSTGTGSSPLGTKFVPALNFKGIMVANAGSINPRIYPPERDSTVHVPQQRLPI